MEILFTIPSQVRTSGISTVTLSGQPHGQSTRHPPLIGLTTLLRAQTEGSGRQKAPLKLLKPKQSHKISLLVQRDEKGKNSSQQITIRFVWFSFSLALFSLFSTESKKKRTRLTQRKSLQARVKLLSASRQGYGATRPCDCLGQN